LLPLTVSVKPDEPTGTVVGDTLATTGAAALGVATLPEPPELPALPEQPAIRLKATKQPRIRPRVVPRQAR